MHTKLPPQVETLKLTVDTTYQTISHLPTVLPRLRSLCFDGSTINSVRDLGTGLRLCELSLNDWLACMKSSFARQSSTWCCSGLTDLDGIGVLCELQKLHVRNNRIEEIAALMMHDHLTVRSLDCDVDRS
jgi:Leucine-rich repeat (LRR) protein